MAKEFSFPFTATYDPETGLLILNEQGEPDILYGADDEAQKNAVFYTSGIMLTPDNQLRVDANGNMTVTVRMGQATIQGRAYELYDGDLILNIPTANATYGRIDSVILSLDLTQQRRSIIVEYKAGTPSITPVVAPLIRTADRWELRLARVAVGANATAILEGNISDDRFNGAFCGVSAFNGAPIDVTGYVNQFEFELSEFIRLTNERAAEQQEVWQAQTDNQQDIWETFWATIHADLQRYSQFNFENWGAFSGVTYETTFPTGKMRKELKITGNDQIVAYRETTWATMATREVVYDSNGVDVLRGREKITTFPSGTIRSVVS